MVRVIQELCIAWVRAGDRGCHSSTNFAPPYTTEQLREGVVGSSAPPPPRASHVIFCYIDTDDTRGISLSLYFVGGGLKELCKGPQP